MIPATFALALGFASLGSITWRRFALYLASIAALTVAVVTAEGMPRPRWTFLHAPQQATIIASQMQEPEAIYLWVLPRGSLVPVAIRLPWDEAMAAQLQQAQQMARSGHTDMVMTARHGKADFSAQPAVALPVKGVGE
jgi:hypothetical protein